MGLVKAAVGAIGGTLADQWKDFLTVPNGIWPSAAIFPAVKVGTNADRGSNIKGSDAIISNGTRIVVPEGYGLLLFQDGGLTALATEPGGYVWNTEDINSQSVFAGDSFGRSLLAQSWDRFKYGGRPGSQQLALFVCLKELPNNKFGTQSEIYWDDSYLNAQVGAITHGTYSVKIIDPIKFATQFVPANFLQGQEVFDFTDRTNPASTQLFNEVVASLAAAFSAYTNETSKGNRIMSIQQDAVGFSSVLAKAVEQGYEWGASRGLEILKVTIVGIEYDENTKELLKTVQRADALSGNRGNANLQASVAQGIQSAGSVDGASGILGLGVAAGSIGLAGMMQTQPQPVQTSSSNSSTDSDLVAKLEKLKSALDAGLINQSDFDAAKAKALGLD
jgi:membrane protease subunit (stomatin/prohibitin family)